MDRMQAANYLIPYIQARVKELDSEVEDIAADLRTLRRWGVDLDLPQRWSRLLDVVAAEPGAAVVADPEEQTAPRPAGDSDYQETIGGAQDVSGPDLVVSILRERPGRPIHVADLVIEMKARGWTSGSKNLRNVVANVAAKAANAHPGSIDRPQRGLYVWLPPAAHAPDSTLLVTNEETTLPEGVSEQHLDMHREVIEE